MVVGAVRGDVEIGCIAHFDGPQRERSAARHRHDGTALELQLGEVVPRPRYWQFDVTREIQVLWRPKTPRVRVFHLVAMHFGHRNQVWLALLVVHVCFS